MSCHTFSQCNEPMYFVRYSLGKKFPSIYHTITFERVCVCECVCVTARHSTHNSHTMMLVSSTSSIDCTCKRGNMTKRNKQHFSCGSRHQALHHVGIPFCCILCHYSRDTTESNIVSATVMKSSSSSRGDCFGVKSKRHTHRTIYEQTVAERKPKYRKLIALQFSF